MQNASRFIRVLFSCSLLVTGVLIAGCDDAGSSDSSSGGDSSKGGNALANTRSVTIDLKCNSSGFLPKPPGEKADAKASDTLTIGSHYENSSGSDYNLFAAKMIRNVLYNNFFNPMKISEGLSNRTLLKLTGLTLL